jgi:hypothetical protein
LVVLATALVVSVATAQGVPNFQFRLQLFLAWRLRNSIGSQPQIGRRPRFPVFG